MSSASTQFEDERYLAFRIARNHQAAARRTMLREARAAQPTRPSPGFVAREAVATFLIATGERLRQRHSGHLQRPQSPASADIT